MVLLREPPEDERDDEDERDIEVVAEEGRRGLRSSGVALELDDGSPGREPGRDDEGAERDQRPDAGEDERLNGDADLQWSAV